MKIKSIYIMLLCWCSVIVQITAKPIIRMGSTNVSSFDENWLFNRYGLQADGTSKPEPANLQNENVIDTDWQMLDLPHDWAINGPFRIDLAGETGKLPYKAIGWYRKHFTIQKADKGKQIYLDFDGAMAYAKVWLNGHYLGTWPYGYSSFRMDLTPYLNFVGENTVAVCLNTEKWDSRWYSGAGIYRHVWMVKTAPVHVAHWGTYISTPTVSDSSASVKLKLTVDNNSNKPVDAIVRTDIFEINKDDIIGNKVASFVPSKVRIEQNGTVETTQSTTITNPKRWDVISPNRYIAQTTIRINGRIIDTYNTSFGVRTIEFTARRGFYLNGRRVAVQGTCNHHDLGALGAVINTSALRRQLIILKEMGCNALRTSHNPPAPELLELADKMGFLVMDEAFDCWKTGKKPLDYNKLYDEWHEKDLIAMIHRDRNNPCVFMWSIGNEVRDQRVPGITKELADIVRTEDPTRPVTNGYNHPDEAREKSAPVSMDVIGINYFFGQQAKWDNDPRYAHIPVIGTETSSCITSRGEYFMDENGKEEEYKDYQISSYDLAHPEWGCNPDTQFRTNAVLPHLLGEFVWTGFDYLGEPTPYNSDETNLLNLSSDPQKQKELETQLEELRKSQPPSRSSYFGIIDLAGFPKDRYYLYQSQWRPELPMAHILPHWNWPERVGKITPVHVYTSGDEAELFINNKTMGRRKMIAGQEFRLVWDSVRYEPGTVKVIAYKNGKQWATDEVKTTGEPVKILLTADRKAIKNDGSDLSYITVAVKDNYGLTVPRSHPEIKFEIEGGGEIVATDNGDATSFVSFQSHTRKAFNGLALVVVKAKKGASGNIIVKAKSEGLNQGSVILTIK